MSVTQLPAPARLSGGFSASVTFGRITKDGVQVLSQHRLPTPGDVQALLAKNEHCERKASANKSGEPT